MHKTIMAGSFKAGLCEIQELGSQPVNQTAARVIAKAGPLGKFETSTQTGVQQEQFQRRIKEVLAHQNIKPMPTLAKDWTGRKFGRIEIVAYSHSRYKKKKGIIHYWIVRCACGKYEMRTHITLGKMCQSHGHGKDIPCEHCKQTEYLQSYAQYIETK